MTPQMYPSFDLIVLYFMCISFFLLTMIVVFWIFYDNSKSLKINKKNNDLCIKFLQW
uniref:ATP synthase F0 subunit 8 n=1 Tax=Ciconiphilus decimfasciatus TaxID=2212705 RepID=UPI00257A138E|nr:ATP synthase F0 subunit 8 [Ciconiphilus decimfasciatus]WGW14986.1 ATP synthase subunit 8 [Ciconiphilus decimfasciatus]